MARGMLVRFAAIAHRAGGTTERGPSQAPRWTWEFGLHPPAAVVAFVASIDGLLW